MAFTQPVDIANRALQRVGARLIDTLADNTKGAHETSFAYPKLLAAELQRTVWAFATKRAALRPYTATTKRFIPGAWAASTDYTIGNIQQDANGGYWTCMVDNTASTQNEPGTYIAGQPQFWQEWFGPIFGDEYSDTVSYYSGELVYVPAHSGGTGDEQIPEAWYLSLTNNNLGNSVSSTDNWCEQIDQSSLIYNFLVAAGFGVTIDDVTRNIFPLPHGFLRLAAQDPRDANSANNVTSGGLRFVDWQLESAYIVSASTDPLVIRYVAHVQDVTQFPDMFAEGISARLALEIVEAMTQSPTKKQQIEQEYQKFMNEASLINWITTASTESREEFYEFGTDAAGVTSTIAPPQPQQGGAR